MPNFKDGRFWTSKQQIAWRNISDQVCPAFSPVTFNWDLGADQPSPWVEDETLLDGGRLALPAFMGGMAETGFANALYAINGPFDVQPNSFGQASIDYPLPVLYDPESFPIPSDPPGQPPTPGTWQEYLEAYPGDIEGPPLLGFLTAQGVEEGWQPATFMADFILWQVVFWQPNADGSQTDNLAIVVPATAVGPIPIGGTVKASTNGVTPAQLNTPVQLLQPNQSFEIPSAGLYQFLFGGTISLQQANATATIKLQVTFGDGWETVDVSGTPAAANAGSFAQLPVAGQTQTLATATIQIPQLVVTSNNDYSLTANNGGSMLPVTGNLGTFTLAFQSYGNGSVAFSSNNFLMVGDTISVVVVATSGNSPVNLQVDGSLSWLKQSNNPIGSFPILY